MADTEAAARIEAEARAKVIWCSGSPQQIAQAEEALRVYFVAKGVTPFEAWTSSNWVQSDADFEDDFGLPPPANDVPTQPRVTTDDELKARVWWNAREVAWRSVGGSVATLDGLPPWEFDVQVAFDHRAWLTATGSNYVAEICNSVDEPSDGARRAM